MNNRARIADAVPLAAALSLYLFIALFLAARLNLWIDEAYTMHSTGSGPLYAIRSALQVEAQAPLYYLVLSVWRSLSDSLLFSRLFSVLCVGGSLLLVVRLARRYLDVPNVLSYLVLLAVLFNPFALWAASEMRSYAFALFLSLVAMDRFHAAFLREKPGLQDFLLFVLAAAAGLYTHYYVALLFPGLGMMLAIRRDRAGLVRFLLCMAAVGILFAPMLSQLFGQMTVYVQEDQAVSMQEKIHLLAAHTESLLLPYGRMPRWLRMAMRAAVFAVLALPLILSRAAPSNRVIRTGALFGGILLACLAVELILDVRLNHVRYLYAIWIPGVLFFFSLAAEGAERHGYFPAAILALLLAGASAGALVENHTPLVKHADYPAAADYIREHAQPGEPILVFNAEAVLPLAYYYTGENELVPIPNPISFEEYDVRRFAVRDRPQLSRLFASALPDAGSFWFVDNHVRGYLGVDYGYDLLEEYLHEYAVPITRREFTNIDIVRFRYTGE